MSGVVRGRVWRGRDRVDGYWLYEVRRGARLEEYERCYSQHEAIHRASAAVHNYRTSVRLP